MVAIVLFASGQSYAQANFGLFGCLGASTVNNHEGSKMRFGAFNIGGFTELGLGEILALEGQLSFANRGDAYDLDFSAGFPPFQTMGSYEGKLLLSYVQIAALMKYIGSETLNLGIGLYAGILLSATDKGDAVVNGVSEEYDEEFTDEAEGVDVGLQIEALYNLSERLGLGLNFQLGFTEVYDPGAGDSPTNTFVGLCAKYRLTNN